MNLCKNIYWLFLVLLCCSCHRKEQVDNIYHHANVYCGDDKMSMAQAFAVKDGKFVMAGSDKEILEKYEATEKIDLQGKYVYPGFNDGHAHFYGLGKYMQTVDLTGTVSWNEVVNRCKAFAETHHSVALSGRGWDQNDWDVKKYPSNEELNKLLPGGPLLLKRVDGHAAIANNYLLKLAGIDAKTKVDGGEVVLENGVPTGVLIDNAVDLVEKVMPQLSVGEKVKALKDAEKSCLAAGLTTVCDAGLDRDIIELIDSLQKQGELHIRLYAMISISDANLDHYLKQEPYKTNLLNVRSFKLYGDGALGSRGACLLKPYDDLKGHQGFLLTPANKIEAYVKRVAESKYQLNTHCIGDSSNRLLLGLYQKYLHGTNDKRWRIEHAQVINESDFHYFKDNNIVPSVQPTHATSDMYWAGDRIGKKRLQFAYAYKMLLQQNGYLPIGTDFPVESVNPLYTFYAAVARQDEKQYPPGGFQPENALSREEAFHGITIWPAKSAFEENEKGTVEPGKFADFVVLDEDLMKEDLLKIRNAKVRATYIDGKKVF